MEVIGERGVFLVTRPQGLTAYGHAPTPEV